MGYEYLVMALNSARSLQRATPSAQVHLITNLPVPRSLLESIVPGAIARVTELADDAIENRLYKTRIIDFTQAEMVVYLDCDTEVFGDLTEVFAAMGEADFACTINETWLKETADLDGVNLSRICPLNAGATYFRANDRTKAFFSRWHRLYQERGMGRDQPTFTVSVLSDANLRFMPLHWSWNAFPSTLMAPGLKAKTGVMVHHYRHLSEDRAIADRVLTLHRRILTAELPAEHPLKSEALAFEPFADILRKPLFWRIKDNRKLMHLLARFQLIDHEKFKHLISRRSLRREGNTAGQKCSEG